MSCLHLSQLSNIPNPRLSHAVHREECTQCFDNQDLSGGIDVCLSCFNGGCVNDDRNHAQIHFRKLGHPFSLNIKRRVKPTSKRDSTGPPPKKLAILEEREEDKYDWETTLRCWTCEPEGRLLPNASSSPEVQRLCTSIMQSMSSARRSEVKAWEEEIVSCVHSLTLQQESCSPIPASGLAHCAKCELKENLWLCLTCGSLGCGRQQYGGIGGNGHGLQHYQESKHPVSVKLGTITPEGTADIYCYICDDTMLDPELALHLSSFGINVATQSKTEKSITELQIEHNLKFDFSMTDEDGKALDPVFGPGLTGLRNLGNSCYMASTLQVLFSLPAFQNTYLNSFKNHSQLCQEHLPADCLDCQMCKIADGLLSGRYSVPRSGPVPPLTTSYDPMTVNIFTHPGPVFQEGIKPGMLKALVGKGHEEFSTMRQQDAQEFFTHLVKLIRQRSKKLASKAEAERDPTEVFKFGMEQRLQCLECAGVKYRVDEHDTVSLGVPALEAGKNEEGKIRWTAVRMVDCLEALKEGEEIEYRCMRCAKDVKARKRTAFATFPDVLIIQAMKFQNVGWVPGSKVDVPVDLPDHNVLILDHFLAKGLQPGEELLPEDEKSAIFAFNEAALEQLQSMGFPLIRCQKALLATANTDTETAANWLFEHMEDPDIDAPLPSVSVGVEQAKARFEASSEQVDMICDLGFTPVQARKALAETDGSMERAVDWLFNHPGEDAASFNTTSSSVNESQPPPPVSPMGGTSTLPARFRLKAFISHKGPSVHSGHYVTHVKMNDGSNEEGGWVLFNDEKVVKADVESVRALKRLAYLFVFERI